MLSADDVCELPGGRRTQTACAGDHRKVGAVHAGLVAVVVSGIGGGGSSSFRAAAARVG